MSLTDTLPTLARFLTVNVFCPPCVKIPEIDGFSDEDIVFTILFDIAKHKWGRVEDGEVLRLAYINDEGIERAGVVRSGGVVDRISNPALLLVLKLRSGLLAINRFAKLWVVPVTVEAFTIRRCATDRDCATTLGADAKSATCLRWAISFRTIAE